MLAAGSGEVRVEVKRVASSDGERREERKAAAHDAFNAALAVYMPRGASVAVGKDESSNGGVILRPTLDLAVAVANFAHS